MKTNKPMYRVIMEELKEQIKNRDFDYNVPITTEQKLTEKYGVSRITAMRALEELDKAGIIYRKRGSGSFVTSAAIFNIEEEKEKNTPTIIAAKAEGTVSIAMVFPIDVMHTYTMECFSAASEVINRKGYLLSVYNSCRDQQREADILCELVRKGVDGIICYPKLDNYNAEIYTHCAMSGIPFVLLDRYVEGLPVPHVISDNYKGTRMLAESIISKGHKRIAFLSELSVGDVTSLKGRYIGYIDTLQEHNIPLDMGLVKVKLSDKYNLLCERKHLKREEYHYHEFLAEQVKELYRNGATAILCENDWIAMQVIRACRSIGISVPETMSVAGFDNVNKITPLGEELTTVEQNFYEIGRRAAEIICAQIETDTAANIRNVVPVKLIEGTTVKTLR